MDTTQNTSAEVPKPKQSTYETIDESIAKMKLTFDNATLPEIFDVLQTVGYTVERISLLKSQLTQLESLHQNQAKESADQYAETEKFNIKHAEIDSGYTTHRALLRILFKGNTHAWTALNLDELKPRNYPAWFQQVSNFYGQLTETSELQTKANTVGVTDTKVAAQKQALADLQSLKESQRKETAEAQAATEARDLTFDALYPQYTEYIQYAKILLAGNQVLEAIGVKVK